MNRSFSIYLKLFLVFFFVCSFLLQITFLSPKAFCSDVAEFESNGNPPVGAQIDYPPEWIQGCTLVLLSTNDIDSANKARDYIISNDGEIFVLSPPHAMVGRINPTVADELLGKFGIESIFYRPVSLEEIRYKDKQTVSLVKFFNYVTSGEFEKTFLLYREKGEPLINDALQRPLIDHGDYLRNLSDRGMNVVGLKEESDRFRGEKYGFLSPGNSDSLIGTVACCLFYIESDGSINSDQYTWTQAAFDLTYNQCLTGLSWWASNAQTRGISLSFTLFYYASPDTNQGYEPIVHSSSDDYLWINAIMSNLGYTTGSKFTRVDAFNTDLNNQAGTDWAYSVFIAYNPTGEGAAKRFTDDRFAYAYLGGPYTQLLYKNNGWSVSDIWRILAHETGHIFWACDEYYQEGYGGCTSCDPCNSYRPILNGNCEHPSCNPVNTVPCIMRHSEDAICHYTAAQIGWGLDEPPTTSITLPLTGEEVSGIVTIEISATDDDGISRVEFYVNVGLEETDTTAPYQFNWDTSSFINGDHTIRAVVYDSILQTGEDAITLVILPRASLNFSYHKEENKSLLLREFINVLSWEAYPLNAIVKYRIYQVEDSSQSLLGEVNVPYTEYLHRNVDGDKEYTYALVAVDPKGREGEAAYTTGQGVYGRTGNTQVTRTALSASRQRLRGGESDTSRRDSLNTMGMDLNKSILAKSTKALKPLNFAGQQVLNSSLSQTEHTNVLSWQANPNSQNTEKYRIYLVEGKIQSLLVELSTDSLEYIHRDVEKNRKYKYALVAVDSMNRESEPIYTKID
ncbi:MAG: hypothetical protein E3J44_05130 [Candidatus Aminicenantes bacterium]|nr:MAG: hypothetical protein E3J44_05130 [Candidatus Aminicenantes bacterium]